MKKPLSLSAAALLTVLTQFSFSWGETGFGPGQSMAPAEALEEARASQAPAAPRLVPVGYVRGDDPSEDLPGEPVEWIPIDAGTFTMGTDDRGGLFKDAKPIHQVAVENFDMSKTLVTVEQYVECVIKGGCTQPQGGNDCNWGQEGRRRHPVNCVTWEQANDYARFMGARLPSESEYEYAATSGGKNQKYPWGNEAATCDRAVMYGHGGRGCGSGGTMAVCSKLAGNSAQGLCDMVGNVWEWVQDKYQSSYAGAPADGRAFEAAGSNRVMRGGSFYTSDAGYLRADSRNYDAPDHSYDGIGFRLARSGR